VAVDEAHCVSEWGHAFRPAYEQLGACLDDLRPRHLLALTATAGPQVRDDIVRSLRMPGAVVEVAGFDRPNLHLEAHVLRTDAEKLDTVASALRGRTPAIVYAATRRRVETLAVRLKGLGYRTGAYHAGLGAEARGDAQDRFLDGALLDRCLPHCETRAWVGDLRETTIRAVDIKTAGPQMWGFDDYLGRSGRSIPEKNAAAWWRKHFPRVYPLLHPAS
jgi:ATP-dependent DNA helicase RecQ